MNQQLIKAIEERQLITFSYRGEARSVEPYTYGVQHNGNESLSGWQISGGSGEGFRLFLVEEILSLDITDEHFESERPAYRKGDRRFSQIFAEI